MSITNISKPTTSLTNTDRIASYETWASVTSTWSSESRTWDDMGSLVDNVSKPTTTIINIIKPA